MRIVAAVKWYELGEISQGEAANIAGWNRWEFMNVLSRYRVSPFQDTPEEIAEELASVNGQSSDYWWCRWETSCPDFKYTVYWDSGIIVIGCYWQNNKQGMLDSMTLAIQSLKDSGLWLSDDLGKYLIEEAGE